MIELTCSKSSFLSLNEWIPGCVAEVGERSVIKAFQEANAAIMTFRKAREVYDAQLNQEKATRKYQGLAKLQYLNGVINYLDLLDAQRSLFDAEIQRNNAKRDELLSMVYLYKALGGGWKQ